MAMENFRIPIHVPEEVIDHFANTVIARINDALDQRLDALKTTPLKLTRQEVCKMLKISAPTLGQYERKGYVKGERIGRRVLYDAKSIESFLQGA